MAKNVCVRLPIAVLGIKIIGAMHDPDRAWEENWDTWHLRYDEVPRLQERLRVVQGHIVEAIHALAPGPVRLLSLCAGDGRDVLGALRDHPRRDDVVATLLDTHEPSLQRGRAMAEDLPVRFVCADATVAKNLEGSVPTDVLVLSGVLGHVRPGDVEALAHRLPSLVRPGGFFIWNRRLALRGGNERVARLLDLLSGVGFIEREFLTTSADGYAAGLSRFSGAGLPFDPRGRLFEFVSFAEVAAGMR